MLLFFFTCDINTSVNVFKYYLIEFDFWRLPSKWHTLSVRNSQVLLRPWTQHSCNPVWCVWEEEEGYIWCTCPVHSVKICRRTRPSCRPSLFSSAGVNRSKAGAGGSLSAARGAALPVEWHRAPASALDRRTGWDVPAHLHPSRDSRGDAEARVSGRKGKKNMTWNSENL